MIQMTSSRTQVQLPFEALFSAPRELIVLTDDSTKNNDIAGKEDLKTDKESKKEGGDTSVNGDKSIEDGTSGKKDEVSCKLKAWSEKVHIDDPGEERTTCETLCVEGKLR